MRISRISLFFLSWLIYCLFKISVNKAYQALQSFQFILVGFSVHKDANIVHIQFHGIISQIILRAFGHTHIRGLNQIGNTKKTLSHTHTKHTLTIMQNKKKAWIFCLRLCVRVIANRIYWFFVCPSVQRKSLSFTNFLSMLVLVGCLDFWLTSYIYIYMCVCIYIYIWFM